MQPDTRSPFSGRFVNNHLLWSPSPLHWTTHTVSSSTLDTFFSFFMGNTITVGILSVSIPQGIGAHSLQSDLVVDNCGELESWGLGISTRIEKLSDELTCLCITFASFLQRTNTAFRVCGLTHLITQFHQSLSDTISSANSLQVMFCKSLTWFQSPTTFLCLSPEGKCFTRSSAAHQRNLIVAGAVCGACTARRRVRRRWILPSTWLFVNTNCGMKWCHLR